MTGRVLVQHMPSPFTGHSEPSDCMAWHLSCHVIILVCTRPTPRNEASTYWRMMVSSSQGPVWSSMATLTCEGIIQVRVVGPL